MDDYDRLWAEFMIQAIPYDDYVILCERYEDWNLTEGQVKEMKKLIKQRKANHEKRK